MLTNSISSSLDLKQIHIIHTECSQCTQPQRKAFYHQQFILWLNSIESWDTDLKSRHLLISFCRCITSYSRFCSCSWCWSILVFACVTRKIQRIINARKYERWLICSTNFLGQESQHISGFSPNKQLVSVSGIVYIGIFTIICFHRATILQAILAITNRSLLKKAFNSLLGPCARLKYHRAISPGPIFLQFYLYFSRTVFQQKLCPVNEHEVANLRGVFSHFLTAKVCHAVEFPQRNKLHHAMDA